MPTLHQSRFEPRPPPPPSSKQTNINNPNNNNTSFQLAPNPGKTQQHNTSTTSTAKNNQSNLNLSISSTTYHPTTFNVSRTAPSSHPSALITYAANESSLRTRQVTSLLKEKHTIACSLDKSVGNEERLMSQLREVKSERTQAVKALDSVRKVCAALVEERNHEKVKAEDGLKRISKLESKLCLSLSTTSLAKINTSLRAKMSEGQQEVEMLKTKNKALEEEALRSGSEINVLSRAVEFGQEAMDEKDVASSSHKNRSADRNKSFRLKLLYQLSLKKEETHNLALDLAFKTQAFKSQSLEVRTLSDKVDKLQVDLSGSEDLESRLTNELTEMEQKFVEVENQNVRKQNEINDLISGLENMTSDKMQCESTIRSLNDVNVELEKNSIVLERSISVNNNECERRIQELEVEINKKYYIIQATEEKLRIEISARKNADRIVKKEEGNVQIIEDLTTDLELLARKLTVGESAMSSANIQIQSLNVQRDKDVKLSSEMKKEMEVTLSTLEQMTRERDAALTSLLDYSNNSHAPRHEPHKEVIRSLATSKNLLQKALMEQLGNSRIELNKERVRRLRVDEEVRNLKGVVSKMEANGYNEKTYPLFMNGVKSPQKEKEVEKANLNLSASSSRSKEKVASARRIDYSPVRSVGASELNESGSDTDIDNDNSITNDNSVTNNSYSSNVSSSILSKTTPKATPRTNNYNQYQINPNYTPPLPMTPSPLPQRKLKIKIKSVGGNYNGWLGESSDGRSSLMGFLEVSSSGMGMHSSNGAVSTKGGTATNNYDDDEEGGGGEGGIIKFNQTLQLVISPSAVLKFQFYRGDPFESGNEMVAFGTVMGTDVSNFDAEGEETKEYSLSLNTIDTDTDAGDGEVGKITLNAEFTWCERASR